MPLGGELGRDSAEREPLGGEDARTDDDRLLAFDVRIPVETRERLARVGEAMSKRALTELPASVVVRAAIDRGLDALESELGTRAKR